jgi:succinate-semialdehyde dehydrogenase/glutarate-semialdehyde dehydrogenase
LRRETDDYAKLLTLEMGKLFAEAKLEVALAANIFDYYAKNAERLLTPERLPVADAAEGEAILVCEPLGVLLAIEPGRPYHRAAALDRQHDDSETCV